MRFKSGEAGTPAHLPPYAFRGSVERGAKDAGVIGYQLGDYAGAFIVFTSTGCATVSNDRSPRVCNELFPIRNR